MVDGLEALNRELGVPTPAGIRHRRGDVERQAAADGASRRSASGSPGNNPRVPDAEEIVLLYNEVWTGAPRNAAL